MLKQIVSLGCAVSLSTMSAIADEFVNVCIAGKPDSQSEEQANIVCNCLAEETSDNESLRTELSKVDRVVDLAEWLEGLSDDARAIVEKCMAE